MKNLSRRDFLRGLSAVGVAVALEAVIGRGASVQERASDNSSMVDMPELEPARKYLESLTCETNICVVERCHPQLVLVAGDDGTLLLSRDSGRNWEQMQ